MDRREMQDTLRDTARRIGLMAAAVPSDASFARGADQYLADCISTLQEVLRSSRANDARQQARSASDVVAALDAIKEGK